MNSTMSGWSSSTTILAAGGSLTILPADHRLTLLLETEGGASRYFDERSREGFTLT
jgi:hypothetical protein